MPDRDPVELEKFKAKIRWQEQVWEARLRLFMHSDQGAVQIGLVALRTSILINAGAIVAVLAFAAQLWEKDKTAMRAMLEPGESFLWGLAFASLATGIAYFYQSGLTAKYHHELSEVSADSENLKPMRVVPKFIRITGITMVVLVFAGLGFFLHGTYGVANALNP